MEKNLWKTNFLQQTEIKASLLFDENKDKEDNTLILSSFFLCFLILYQQRLFEKFKLNFLRNLIEALIQNTASI